LTRRPSRWSDGLIDRPLELRAIALLAAIAIGLTAPSPAAGHAGLVSVTPADGAVVEAAPAQVVLRFNQPVKAELVRIFDGVARPVAVGKVTQPGPYEVAAPIEGTLPRGTYTVVWRVISDDVDPVSGFLTFHVSARRAEAAAPAGAEEDDGGVGLLLPALLAGGAALALAVGFARAAEPRRRRLGALAGLTGALAAVLVAAHVAGGGEDEGAAASATPFRAQVRMGTLDGRLSIAPARVGWNRIELALPPPTGAEGGYFEVRVWASLKDAGLGPLRFTGIQGTEPGEFAVRRAYLPLPGPWRLRVAARRGVSGRYAATVTVPVSATRARTAAR
jgi:methionine-rich copper-binding protein CopC